MNGGDVKKAGMPIALVALLCLPCLLPVIGAVVGIAAFSAAGGWLAGNGVAVAAASVVAAAGAGLVTYVVIARRRRTSCAPAGRMSTEQE